MAAQSSKELISLEVAGVSLMIDAKLIVRRKFNLLAGLGKIAVVLDGKKIGNVGNGEEKTFEISSGNHTIFIERLSRSEEITFNVPTNGAIECESGISPRFCYLNFSFALFVFIGSFMLPALKPLAYDVQLFVSGLIVGIVIIVGVWVMRENFRPGATYYLKKQRVLNSEGNIRA